MKKIIFALVACSCFAAQISAQGIEFFHGKWDEALEKAKKEEKIIFVDAFAQWCGPCKRMAATAFPDPAVGKFFNDNFVSLKYDMEAPENQDFARKFPVNAYPTLFFISAKGELVQKAVGGRDAKGLLELGQSMSNKVDNSKDFEKAYKEGNREADFMLKYVHALNKAGKSSVKVANEYIASQKNLDTPDMLRFLLEAASEADSKLFDLMAERKDKIVALLGENAVKESIEKACKKTASKAVEFKSKELNEDAKAKMKKYVPEKAAAFALQSDTDYCKAAGDCKGYLKVCETCADAAKNDAVKLHELAQDLEKNFGKDKKAMSRAEKYAKKATENGKLPVYFFTYANILFKNGKKSDALKMANKTIELSKENPMIGNMAEQLITKIKES